MIREAREDATGTTWSENTGFGDVGRSEVANGGEKARTGLRMAACARKPQGRVELDQVPWRVEMVVDGTESRDRGPESDSTSRRIGD